ncbi:hypothetical protein QC760_008699 [Botrytis cinerea]
MERAFAKEIQLQSPPPSPRPALLPHNRRHNNHHARPPHLQNRTPRRLLDHRALRPSHFRTPSHPQRRGTDCGARAKIDGEAYSEGELESLGV